MAITDILAEIDAEINRLQQVRKLLSTTQSSATKPATRKRKWKLSAEARRRIAEGQRKRWAKQKAQK